jgi:Tfp pilus assembly protein PilF
VLPRALLLALLPTAAVFAAEPSLDHAIALHTAGRLPEALREYHALAGSSDPVVAATALSNACVIQNDLGEYKAALPDCRRALEVCRTLGDPETLARALNNLGLVLESLGEPAEAERSFQEALGINRKAGAAESEAVNLSNLGTLALGAGRYTAALELHAQAAALAERHSKEPWAVRFADLGDRRPVLDAVAAVHRALSHGEEPPAPAVAALSRVLLGPVGPLPRGDAPLWIAPDGALHHLPFEILTVAGEPLVERAPVSYLPSASTLAMIQRPEEREDGVRLLGVGDPLLDLPRDGPPTPRALLVERFGLAPLPAASRELAAVGRLLGGKTEVLTRGQATEKAFREAAGLEPRVVHLATHTVIDERPGRGAAILLTPETGDDGLLDPEEIARIGNRSDLTVLAACRTALGPGEDGRALSSLTGAFLAAGSRGVVATLWDVDDAATAAFMEQFYWHLGRGLPPPRPCGRPSGGCGPTPAGVGRPSGRGTC